MIILGIIIFSLLLILGASYYFDRKEKQPEVLYINNIKISALRNQELFDVLLEDYKYEQKYLDAVREELKRRYLLES